MLRSLASEYFGTLLLISVIALIGNPLAIGAALWAAIMLVGKYSGGHFNPAVTLWAFLKGNIDSELAIGHVLAQLAAAATVWKLA
jgi:glycerol uptake facilitator-like aquaporin